MSKNDKTETPESLAASMKTFSLRARDDASRQGAQTDMSAFAQRKAALISAHFLLPAGSRIIDMGCGKGEITYVLALLNPRTEIIGIDHDPACIDFARKNYTLPNLFFRQTDFALPDFEDESVDGIINSNVLHEVYSAAGYNPDEVTHLLEKQMKKLRVGGIMLIRDYMMPPEGEYVLLELSNAPSTGRDVTQLSKADLLILFSQTARPLSTGGCEGFFIEELRPRRENTRLFRLAHKWAVEFIHRSSSPANWHKEIRKEYTFFSYQDYRRECARVGMRMTFSAPYWNPWVVKNCFKDMFQLYSADYKPMSHPATNYFIVSQKVADKQSLVLEERRPSQNPIGELQINVVRDEALGTLHELVKRPGEFCDIIPYRITPDNRLVVFVRSGSPRPIANAVMRGSVNLDGKRWSGHLIEPITMDTSAMTENAAHNMALIDTYVRDFVGLRPKVEGAWYVGDMYFPAPDRIEEAIEPMFIEVENPQKTFWPLSVEKGSVFSETGGIMELDGADIILSSQVGMLPDPRLEMHVLDLMMRHNIAFPRWIGDDLPKLPGQTVEESDPAEMLAAVEKTKFKQEQIAPVHMKAVKAVFVEEGKVGRTTRGLTAQDVEFVVSDEGIENIAIVLPLTRTWDGGMLVGLQSKNMPVPNRMGGEGAMLAAPSFVLPKEVQTIDQAKDFVAAQFKVPVEHVAQLGESFFMHVGVMPQRVYPFTVASPGKLDPRDPLQFVATKKLWKLLGFKYRTLGSALKLISRVNMAMDDNHAIRMERTEDLKKYKDYSLSTKKVSVDAKDAGHVKVPSRILGERGPMVKPAPAAESSARLVMKGSGDKRLSRSYAQAKMLVRETPVMKTIDKNINAIAKTLFDNRQKKADNAPTMGGDKTPPKSRL